MTTCYDIRCLNNTKSRRISFHRSNCLFKCHLHKATIAISSSPSNCVSYDPAENDFRKIFDESDKCWLTDFSAFGTTFSIFPKTYSY